VSGCASFRGKHAAGTLSLSASPSFSVIRECGPVLTISRRRKWRAIHLLCGLFLVFHPLDLRPLFLKGRENSFMSPFSSRRCAPVDNVESTPLLRLLDSFFHSLRENSVLTGAHVLPAWSSPFAAASRPVPLMPLLVLFEEYETFSFTFLTPCLLLFGQRKSTFLCRRRRGHSFSFTRCFLGTRSLMLSAAGVCFSIAVPC